MEPTGGASRSGFKGGCTIQPVILQGGRVVDPSTGYDAQADVVIEAGQIVAVGPHLAPADTAGHRVFDVTGCIVGPGLVDIHVHLRTPGQEHKEDLTSGTAAAAAGGFTAVCFMPNTSPAIDNPEILAAVLEQARRQSYVKVFGAAAVTVGLAGGQLTDLAALRAAGAVVFTDDGLPVTDGNLMGQALAQARELGVPVAQHAETPELTAGGVAHPGKASSRLGLPPYVPESEAAITARDCVLAAAAQARLHVQHVSSRLTTAVLAAAQGQGVQVTAEVTPHHLLLTDAELQRWGRNPITKVNPPLRGELDRQALIAALVDGTINCIATDHAPHHAEDKNLPYEKAAFGISGFETALSASVAALVQPGWLDWPRLFHRMSTAPARLLDLPGGQLSPGQVADVTVVDPAVQWRVEPDKFFSKGKNTPLADRTLPARVVLTLVDGRVVYDGLDARRRQVLAADGTSWSGPPLTVVPATQSWEGAY